MDREGLAAVVARSGQNFSYLSGAAYSWKLGTFARHLDMTDSDRSVLLLWPRKGDPVVIANAMTLELTRKNSWLKRFAVYDAYNESPYHRLCEVIKEAGLAEERIGFEKNFVSAGHWEEVRAQLPRIKMVDCVSMMNQVRWVKTPAEIDLIKNAADLLDDAFLEVFLSIRPGEAEGEIHARMLDACRRRGADWTHGILHSGRSDRPLSQDGNVAFKTGDVIRTDFITYLQRYPGHASRNAVLGMPSADLKNEYRLYRDIYRRTMNRFRPGVRAGEVYAFLIEDCKRNGWTYESPMAGHGVGAWWHQQEPIIARGRDIPLEEGMVLALQPLGLPPGKGYLHLQDLILVERDGPRLLSDKFSTDEIFTIT